MKSMNLASEIKLTFEAHQSEVQAVQLAAYMKNKFPFLGIKKPLRAELSKPFLKQKLSGEEELQKLVSDLWDFKEREYQYVAIEFLYRQRKLLTIDSIPFLEKLIVAKSWWDTVDALAARIVGPLLLNYPLVMKAEILPWIASDDLWLNRSAIIFQLKYKAEIRLDILTDAIEAHTESKEFFHAKAIGWALRQHSKIDPEWVSKFISSHKLQPLSIREGGKYL